MHAKSSTRVENMDLLDRTVLVSFLAQICAIPPHMKESAYKIFILSSMKVSSCIVTVIQMDQMDSAAPIEALWLSCLGTHSRVAPSQHVCQDSLFCRQCSFSSHIGDIILNIHHTVIE